MNYKPREWLIETDNPKGSRIFELRDDQFFLEYRGKPPISTIRVIERSAYEQVLDVAKDCDMFREENIRLRKIISGIELALESLVPDKEKK